jgi:abhydrolase domain-containing protein 5
MTEEFMKVYREALAYANLNVDEHLKYRNVPIYEKDHMHEVYTLGNKKLPHLVLLHGYGGTSLTFIRMFEKLREDFQVHALDTFGVGLSSRGNWQSKMTAEETVDYYLESIEEWRKTIGLEHFILAGHSFGGYLSTLYLERYTQRVDHLMLLSPAGTARFTDEEIDQRTSKSKFWYFIAEKVYNMNIRPAKIMNSWWLGNKFMDKFFQNRLKLPEEEQVVWKKYMKHIVKQSECSEDGFYKLFGWPLQPARSI